MDTFYQLLDTRSREGTARGTNSNVGQSSRTTPAVRALPFRATIMTRCPASASEIPTTSVCPVP